MKKVVKYPLYGLLILIVLLIIAIPLIPADRYRQEIEAQIGGALNVDVVLGDISLTSLPLPGLVIEDIKLSADNKHIISADRIVIAPILVTLFSDTPVIRKISLTGVRFDVSKMSHLTQGTDTSDSQKSPPVSIKRIAADNSYLVLEDKTQIGPFEFSLDLDKGMGLKSFELSLEQQVFKLDVEPENGNYAINLQARDWSVPVGPKIKFNSLVVHGILQKDRFHARDIQASAYEGDIKGNLIMDWKSGWSLDSRLQVDSLNIEQVLKLFENDSIDGTGSGQFTIRSRADAPEQLLNQLQISGDTQVTNGHIYNADLEQAVRSFSKDWSGGGQTPFDNFKTHIDMSPSRIQLTQMQITSSALAAKGHLAIHEMKDLKGELSVGLNDLTGIVTMPLMVGGTVDEPKVRPTDSALTGGAVGTAILGPGVGTAVGIKAGELAGKIGSFFSSDDDKKEEPEQTDDDDDTSF